MARLAVEHKFTGTTGPIDSISTPTVVLTNVGTTGLLLMVIVFRH